MFWPCMPCPVFLLSKYLSHCHAANLCGNPTLSITITNSFLFEVLQPGHSLLSYFSDLVAFFKLFWLGG